MITIYDQGNAEIDLMPDAFVLLTFLINSSKFFFFCGAQTEVSHVRPKSNSCVVEEDRMTNNSLSKRTHCLFKTFVCSRESFSSKSYFEIDVRI